jgi:hypothetical protein
MPEAVVSVSHNSQGWRDEEHQFGKNNGTFRILVLGDSFMEAYSVNFENTIHKYLERFARENNISLEVINLGVGGYSTLQEYLIFKDIGKKYNPDIVLLGFYLKNDVADNSLAINSMGFKSPESKKIRRRPYLLPATSGWEITQVEYEWARQRYLINKAKLFQRKPGQSALLQAVSHVVKNIRTMWSGMQAGLPRENHEDSEEKNKATQGFVLYGVDYCREPVEYTEAWSITKRILNRLKIEVVGAGGKLFVFTVPSLEEVMPEKLEDISKEKVPKPELICLEEAPGYDRLTEILTELDIEHVNLLPGFRKKTEDQGEMLFRLSDKHWNEQGHYLATEIVYSSLMEKGLIPSGVEN